MKGLAPILIILGGGGILYYLYSKGYFTSKRYPHACPFWPANWDRSTEEEIEGEETEEEMMPSYARHASDQLDAPRLRRADADTGSAEVESRESRSRLSGAYMIENRGPSTIVVSPASLHLNACRAARTSAHNASAAALTFLRYVVADPYFIGYLVSHLFLLWELLSPVSWWLTVLSTFLSQHKLNRVNPLFWYWSHA